MARATGVQISGRSVRVVDLEGSGKKFKVRGFAEASLPNDEDEKRSAILGKAIREAFKSAKASKEHVILGLPTRDCVIREITIPFSQPDQIEKVIKFEAEPHLHSVKIDDVVIEWQKVEDLGNRSTVQVFAVKKDTLKDVLLALEYAGIDPLSIDIDGAGLFNLLKSHPDTEGLSNYVVCDVGYSSSMIALVKNGELRLLRSVRMGTDSILSRVTRDLDLQDDQAKTRAHEIMTSEINVNEDLFIRRGDVEEIGSETSKSANELERDIVRQRQTDFVRRLRQEIVRSLNPAKLEVPLESVFLAGPGANLPRLRGELAEGLDLEVKRLGTLDWFDHSFATAESEVFDPVLPVASGLAMKFVGEDHLKLDFRQEEFVFSKRFDRLKVPLLCMVLFFVFLNGLWWFVNREKEKLIDHQVNVIGKDASPVFDEVVKLARIKKSDLERYPEKYTDSGGKMLKKLHRGASEHETDGLQRIRYMGKTLVGLRDEIRDNFGLNEARTRGRRGRLRRGTDKKNKPFEDPSQYSSALENAEHVLNALESTGIRDFALTRFSATSTEVQFGLIIPTNSVMRSDPTKAKVFLDVIGDIKDYLAALPPEARFVEFQERAQYEPAKAEDYPAGPAKVYRSLIVVFGSETL